VEKSLISRNRKEGRGRGGQDTLKKVIQSFGDAISIKKKKKKKKEEEGNIKGYTQIGRGHDRHARKKNERSRWGTL